MWIRAILLLGLAILAPSSLGLSATTMKPEAENCTVANSDCSQCALPDCYCSGTDTSVPQAEKPQIIYLTYDDAFTKLHMDNYYTGIFDNDKLKNPDGCPIRATHFLTAEYTDFTLVHDYWARGHEMASHSITHRTNQDYWKGLNVNGWLAEAEGMRKMISQFAAIPKEDVEGFRAPFLQMGGDEMFTALYQSGFTYDCSWGSRAFGYLNLGSGLFPYSLDHQTVQDCPILPCPKCSYPGFWVQPMLNLEDNWFGANPEEPDKGMPCSMLDGCVIIQDDADRTTVKEMLMRNFNRNRNGNRAPMGLYMHAGWFYVDWHYQGYLDFLQEVTQMDDVWIVPITEGIDYVRNYNDATNADLIAMGENSPFSCKKFEDRVNTPCDAITSCRFANVNNDDINGEERYMHICGKDASGQPQNCPNNYPWLGDPCGGNLPCA